MQEWEKGKAFIGHRDGEEAKHYKLLIEQASQFKANGEYDRHEYDGGRDNCCPSHQELEASVWEYV